MRSRPVGYAAEYLTLAYVRHNMCRFWSMPMLHIIPFLGCLRLSVVVVSIDLRSSKPCFSVEFVDTHSFVPTAITPPPTNTALSSNWCCGIVPAKFLNQTCIPFTCSKNV